MTAALTNRQQNKLLRRCRSAARKDMPLVNITTVSISGGFPLATSDESGLTFGKLDKISACAGVKFVMMLLNISYIQ